MQPDPSTPCVRFGFRGLGTVAVLFFSVIPMSEHPRFVSRGGGLTDLRFEGCRKHLAWWPRELLERVPLPGSPPSPPAGGCPSHTPAMAKPTRSLRKASSVPVGVPDGVPHPFLPPPHPRGPGSALQPLGGAEGTKQVPFAGERTAVKSLSSYHAGSQVQTLNTLLLSC